MKRDFNRVDRVAGLIQRELAQIIQREMQDPRLGLVTLIEVKISKDLAHAKIYLNVMPNEKASETIKILNLAAGFLRGALARQVDLRIAPTLYFIHDEAMLKATDLVNLIDKLSDHGQKKGDRINGILLLDKPLNFSSNQVLQKCRWLLNAQKAGHTGALDPLATGMLPICFGEATKFSRFLLEAEKCYQVIMRLGITTTTGDSEGEVLNTYPVPAFSEDTLKTLLSLFCGKQTQVPPMFSALKLKGQPLYKLARQGIVVERQAREIYIKKLTLDEFSNDSLTLTVVCSKGTYIRTLVEDLGAKLGCGAYVLALRRKWVSPFMQVSMVTLNELIESANRQSYLLPLDKIVAPLLPTVNLSEEAVFRLVRGQVIEMTGVPSGWISLLNEKGEFFGVGEGLEGRIAPRRLLEVSAS